MNSSNFILIGAEMDRRRRVYTFTSNRTIKNLAVFKTRKLYRLSFDKSIVFSIADYQVK